MRRNIKRNLKGLDVLSFSNSSPARRSRRNVAFLPGQSNSDESIRTSTTTTRSPLVQELVQDNNEIDRDFIPSTSFEFQIREVDEDDICSEEERADKKTADAHCKRKQNSAKNWESIRSSLLNVIIESECIPLGRTCFVCNVAPAIFRCISCGIGQYFCENCVESLHKNVCVFHVVEQWKVSNYVRLYI